jgi:hypothetical protein
LAPERTTVAFSTQPRQALVHQDPSSVASGYQVGTYAGRRIYKVRELAEFIGGTTNLWSPDDYRLISEFGLYEGLAAALLTQKGFPKRQAMQVAIAGSEDLAAQGLKPDSGALAQLTGEMLQIALPGQILLPEGTWRVIKELIASSYADWKYEEPFLEHTPLATQVELLGKNSDVYDLSPVIASKHLHRVAKAIEEYLANRHHGIEAVKDAIIDSGPYRELLEHVTDSSESGEAGGRSSVATIAAESSDTVAMATGSGAPTALPAGGDPPDPSERDASGPDDRPRKNRYLNTRFPKTVELESTYQLLARIVLQGEPGDVPFGKLSIPVAGIDITLSIHAPGFDCLSDQVQTCHVPSDADSDPVFFNLKVTQRELGPIEVTAFHGSTYLGEANLHVALGTAEGSQSAQQKTTLAGQPRSGGKTLTMNINYVENENTYKIGLFGPNAKDVEDPVRIALARPRVEVVKRLVDQLDRLARGVIDLRGNAAKLYLEGLGTTLWNELLPPSVQKRILNLADSIEEILVLSAGDPMPWEALRPGRSGAESFGFLAEAFHVTRTLKRNQFEVQEFAENVSEFAVKRAMFVLGDDSPPTAEKEVEALTKLLQSHQVECQTVTLFDDLLQRLQKDQYDLIHFTCHNEFEFDGRSLENTAVSINSQSFNTTFLQNMTFKRRPLVFMNACTSAQNDSKITGMSGWATSFKKAGAGGFVGTLWEVRDKSASKFAETWYQRLADSDCVGAAFRAARSTVKQSDPTRLAFTAYIDATALVRFN